MTPPVADSTASVRPVAGRNAHESAPTITATDGERLMRFRVHRDEAAFHDVVRRHAPLVWGVCWQVLRHREDVEDAFQATFLILARKASSIRAADSAAGWLYRVAFRTALATRQRRRWLGMEPLVDDPPAPLEEQFAAIERSEHCEKLLEELHALSARYRQPLVLCYLEGRSRQEAADELGLTMATVKGRLARGLRMLRTRLAHRGLALSGAAALLTREMAAAQASAALAPAAQTAALATTFAYGTPTVGVGTSAAAGSGAAAITLAKKGLLAMKLATAAKPVLGLLAVGMTAGALALAASEAPEGGSAGGPSRGRTVVELVADRDETAVRGESGPLANSITEGDAGTLTVSDVVTEISTDVAVDHANVSTTSGAATIDIAEGVTVFPGAQNVDVLTTTDAPVARAMIEDVLIAAPAPVGPAKKVRVRLQPPPPHIEALAPQQITKTLVATTSPTPPASREVMALEREYWTLKGRGLRHKAEAMAAKYRGLEEQHAVSRNEVLANQAEVELLQAEANLCDARAKQLAESLEAPAAEDTGATGITISPPTLAMTAPAGPIDARPATIAVAGLPAVPGATPAPALILQAQSTPVPGMPPQPSATPQPALTPAAGGAPHPPVGPQAMIAPVPALPAVQAAPPLAMPTPAILPPTEARIELDDRSAVLIKMAADMKQQFEQLRAENEALRRQVEDLRRTHEDNDPNDDPKPETF